MNLWSNHTIRNRAAELTRDNPEFRRLVTIHTAISLGISLAISLLNALLSSFNIQQTGLAGMDVSAILTTVTSTLNTLWSLALPFWSLGVLYASIRVTRKQPAEFYSLTRGFQRWGAVIRFYILLIIAGSILFMVLTNLLSIAASLLMPLYELIFPAPANLQESLAGLEAAMATFTETADIYAFMDAIPKEWILYTLPIMILIAVVLIVIILHFYYRLRMSQYVLSDDFPTGARIAIRESNRMTKGYKWQLFKLDLSFWWYSLLIAAATSLGELPYFVNLPLPEHWAFLLAQVVSCLANIGLVWLFGARIQATYACAYDELRAQQQDTAIIPQ